MTDAVPALELSGIVKHFGSVRALDGANLSLQLGTIHALLGENGAGKTTLMKVAFGMLRPDAGQLSVAGRPVAWRSPLDAIRAGVGMVHQHFTLVPAMTVAENVELGAVSSIGWRFDQRATMERVRELGQSSGLAVEPHALVEELSVATQQRVEILKALDRAARILILDEPTAVLAPRETEELLRWLRSYTTGGGTAVLITHKLREALAVADDVTVLRHGRTILTTSSATTDETTLTRAMIGGDAATDAATDSPTARPSRHAPHPAPRPAPDPAGTVASLEEVVATSAERRESIRATFAIHTGDIIGIAGVEGAGQYTLLRVLARRIRPTTGRLTLPPEVGFIPEDRQRDGLVLEFSLTDNVALRGAGTRRGRMAWAALRQRTSVLLREFDVRAPDGSTPAGVLSGGNQQRLVLARELEGGPPLIVAENPTRGLDVRATADVHDRLRDARDAGAAVVFYSSDLDEVLALATRVVVVHAGETRETPLDRDLVGQAMLGLRPADDAKPTPSNSLGDGSTVATAESNSADTAPQRWRILALLAIAELLGMSIWFAGNAVSMALAARSDLAPSTGAAWLMTAVQIGFVCGTAVAAVLNLADLLPAARYFAASAFLGALANAALLATTDFRLALATRFLTGFFLAGVYPPAMKMVATWFRARRGLAIGTVVGALTVGKAMPYLVLATAGTVATTVATTASSTTPVDSTSRVVLAASMGALVAALLVLAGYRDGPYPFQPRPFSWNLVADVARIRRWRLATSGYLGHMWELYAFWTWIPAFIAASLQAQGSVTVQTASQTRAASIAFLTIAIGGIGCVWGGLVADRTGRERLVIRAMAASGVCALLMPAVFGRATLALAVLASLWGFFVIADSAQFSALVTESVPPHAVGTALTLQTSIGFLLTTVSIQIVPILVGIVGWLWAFPMLALGPAAGIVAIRRLIALQRSSSLVRL